MNKKYFFGALALGASFLLQSTVVLAGDRYVQSNVLHVDNGLCTGAVSGGKVQLKEQSGTGDIKYVATLTNAVPAGTYTAYWVCTTVARGCHANACGFITAGTIVKGAGTLTSTFTLPSGNPFPGNYVHVDIIGPKSYTATFAGIPATGPLSTSAKLPAVQAGDPSQK